MNASAGALASESWIADPWWHNPSSAGVAFAWFANSVHGGSTRRRTAAGASSRSSEIYSR